jgi:hypothetical protein
VGGVNVMSKPKFTDEERALIKRLKKPSIDPDEVPGQWDMPTVPQYIEKPHSPHIFEVADE